MGLLDINYVMDPTYVYEMPNV